MDKVVISIIIPTYNHEQYIQQAIESALNQECSYSYEILIGDDCSTDRTKEICQYYTKHPGIQLLSHQQNLGLINNYRSLFSASNGDYIAILEGDDFWEKNKLAEQIAYLEAHPNYGFIHSNAYLLFENGNKTLLHDNPLTPREYTYKEIFTSNRIAAVTVCFRKELLQYTDLDRFESLGFKTIDLPLWLEFAQHVKLAYIDKPLATYRITANAISNNRSIIKRTEFETSNRSILEYYSQKFPTPGIDQRFILEKFYVKMYYSILYYGTFADMKIFSGVDIPLARFKRLAIKSRYIFVLYKVILKLFYKRV